MSDFRHPRGFEEALNEVISMDTSANCRAPAAPLRARWAQIASPMGYIIAVVAVLLWVSRGGALPPVIEP